MPKIYKYEIGCPACGSRENEEEEVEEGHVFRFQCFRCSYAEVVYRGREIDPPTLVASGFKDAEGARKIVGNRVVDAYDKDRATAPASHNPNIYGPSGKPIPRGGGMVEGF